MSLCLYPINRLVSTIAPGHHACILQLQLTSSHVFIRSILSACMSVTVSSYQHPCILHLHLSISHVCTIAPGHFQCHRQLHLASSQIILQTCAYKHACLIHLHRTSLHVCYSNIQPSVLSVALALFQQVHLQQTRKVVMVVTIAPGKQACTNQQSRW